MVVCGRCQLPNESGSPYCLNPDCGALLGPETVPSAPPALPEATHRRPQEEPRRRPVPAARPPAAASPLPAAQVPHAQVPTTQVPATQVPAAQVSPTPDLDRSRNRLILLVLAVGTALALVLVILWPSLRPSSLRPSSLRPPSRVDPPAEALTEPGRYLVSPTPMPSPSATPPPISDSAPPAASNPDPTTRVPATTVPAPGAGSTARTTAAADPVPAPATTTRSDPPVVPNAKLTGSGSTFCGREGSSFYVTLTVTARLSGAASGTKPTATGGQADSMRSFSLSGSGGTTFSGSTTFYAGAYSPVVSIFGSAYWSATVTLPNGDTTSDSGSASFRC